MTAYDAAVYATAAPIYWQAGWRGILPVPAGEKKPVPTGYSGHNGTDPSFADLQAWTGDRPDDDLVLRLPDDVMGIDVDAYDTKTGARTLAEGERRWGKLPWTARSTARDDGVSGIRLYRVPPGTMLVDRIAFPELGCGDIEIIQHHHRYAKVWPSRHHNGHRYGWLHEIDLSPLDAPPAPDDLPDLPPAWIEGLAQQAVELDGGPGQHDVELGGAAYRTGGKPSTAVDARYGAALVDLAEGHSRHDTMCANVMRLLRLGRNGEPGVDWVLRQLRTKFVATVASDRDGSAGEAAAEFDRFITNPRAGQLLADGPEDEPDDDDGVERRIEHRLQFLRVNAEAQRRLDDELHPQPVPPPVKSLPALLAEPDTPIRYRIAELAPTESRIILSAPYKAGKTIIVGNLMRGLADNDAFLGRFAINTPAQHLVLIDDELSENMLRRWLRDQQIINTAAVADVVTLRGQVGAFNLIDDRCRNAWVRRLADLGCDYLVLDCLRPVLDALGLDESHEAGCFLVQFDALLAAAGITDALLIHHMGHANERARGDSRLQDWPDAIWRIVREDPDNPSSARYFSAVGRDVNVPEGRLGFDPGIRRLTYVPGSRLDAKAEAALRAVIALLAENRGEKLSMNAIETELSGPGRNHARNAVRDALMRAAASGVVSQSTGARNARLHEIARPCAECGWPLAAGQESRHAACPDPMRCELPEELLF